MSTDDDGDGDGREASDPPGLDDLATAGLAATLEIAERVGREPIAACVLMRSMVPSEINAGLCANVPAFLLIAMLEGALEYVRGLQTEEGAPERPSA